MKSIKKLGIALALMAPSILVAPAVSAFEAPERVKLEAQVPILASYRIDAPRSACATKDAVAPARHPCSDEAKELAVELLSCFCGSDGGWGLFWCDEQGKLIIGEVECGTRPPDGMVTPR